MFGRYRESNDRFARGCVMAKHARGFQRVLTTQESQDMLNVLILASEIETIQELLWLHKQSVFRLNIIDDYRQSIYTSTEKDDGMRCPVYIRHSRWHMHTGHRRLE